MDKNRMEKLIFIDTNIFISCSIEQLEERDLGILRKFLKKLDNEEMRLVLPENIKNEILYKLEEKFENIKYNIDNSLKRIIEEKKKEGKILEKSLTQAKSISLKDVEEV